MADAPLQPPRRRRGARRAAEDGDAGGRAIHGVWVAAVALIALVGIVAIAVLTLPDAQKGQNIIAITSASFAVIGAIVGAYFGVSSANRAAEIVNARSTPPERTERVGGSEGA